MNTKRSDVDIQGSGLSQRRQRPDTCQQRGSPKARVEKPRDLIPYLLVQNSTYKELPTGLNHIRLASSPEEQYAVRFQSLQAERMKVKRGWTL